MKRILITVIVAVCAIFTTKAQEIDLMQVVENDPSVRAGTLDNGIKYYIRANKKDPKLANFHIVYNVGAVQEEDRQDGLAHFLEHMAFNGSKNFPDNSMIEYLQSIGVKFGENLNAGTGIQSTTYMITSAPVAREAVVDSILLILHDWAGFISLNEDDIDKERGVIQEEFRLYEGMASWRANRQMRKALFGADNIYARRDLTGTLDNLKNFTYADIRDFYKKWYRPDMQAFVIVGDVDVDQIEAKLKKVMADIKPSEEKAPKEIVRVEDNDSIRVAIIIDPELTSTGVDLLFRHRPIAWKYNNRVLKLKNDIVTALANQMLNERLGNIAKSEGAPFQSSHVYSSGYYEPFDMFSLSTVSREGEAIEAFTAAYTELLRMKRSGFVMPELDRAKANLNASFQNAYNNRNDRSNEQYTGVLMNNFLDNTPYPSAETDFELSKKLLDAITIDEVNLQAASLVGDKNCVLTLSAQKKDGVVLPTKEELLAVMSSVAASQIEPYTETENLKPLMDASKLKGSAVKKTEEGKFESTVWTLKNGIKVVVKPTTLQADQILFRSFKKGGTSTLASLDDLYSINLYGSFENTAGLADFTDTELTRLLTGKQVGLSPVINETMVGYSGQSTIKDFETMLQLTYLYATAPRFNKADWNVMIDKITTQIKGAEKDPMRIFQDSLVSTMSGGDPRRANLSLDMLSRVSMERMERVYKEMFASADGMTFTITGSVVLDSIKPLVEKYIGSLPVVKSKKEPQVGPYIQKPIKGYHENIFTTPQEAGRVISVTAYMGDVKYSLAEDLNLSIAGEALQNLYTRTIREAKSGAYVVQDQMVVSSFPRPSFVNIVLFMTDTTKLAALQPEVQLGVDSLVKVGPSKEEITKATEAMVKQFNERNMQNSTWATYLRSWYMMGNDNYTTYLEELSKVTVESVRQAAKRAFDQGNKVLLIQQP